MSKQQASISAVKINDVDRPVLYSGGVQSTGKSIYHLPKYTDGGRVMTLCKSDPRNLRHSSYEVFSRRRNPTLCAKCRRAGGEPYGGDSDG